MTPCVSEGARSLLPVSGVCQRLKLDVALTSGVCVVSDSSRGRELLLLLCSNNPAAFCSHSHAVVLWNEAKRKDQSQTGCVTHTFFKGTFSVSTRAEERVHMLAHRQMQGQESSLNNTTLFPSHTRTYPHQQTNTLPVLRSK